MRGCHGGISWKRIIQLPGSSKISEAYNSQENIPLNNPFYFVWRNLSLQGISNIVSESWTKRFEKTDSPKNSVFCVGLVRSSSRWLTLSYNPNKYVGLFLSFCTNNCSISNLNVDMLTLCRLLNSLGCVNHRSIWYVVRFLDTFSALWKFNISNEGLYCINYI